MTVVADLPFDMSDVPTKDFNSTEYYSEIMQEVLMKEYVSMSNIESSVNSCMLCPLNEYIKPLNLAKGNEKKHLMIIGNDPTDVLPQYSKGSYLHELLSQFNYNKDHIHFTSLVKCVGSTNYKDCHHHLISEVISIEPAVIIALGYNVAFPFMAHIAEQYNQQLVPGAGYTLENGSDMIVVNNPSDIRNEPQSVQELNGHIQMAFNHLNTKITHRK